MHLKNIVYSDTAGITGPVDFSKVKLVDRVVQFFFPLSFFLLVVPIIESGRLKTPTIILLLLFLLSVLLALASCILGTQLLKCII